FLDNTDTTQHVRVTRTWQPAGWPVTANFPPGGPVLLAIDMDGDGKQDIVWAGGDSAVTDTSAALRAAVRDSAALFCVRFEGKGLGGADTLDFAPLDQRPRREVAAARVGSTVQTSLVVATTYHYGPSDAVGGKLWAVDATGASPPGFPVTLLSPASTPPVTIAGGPTWLSYVGCEDGRVRAIGSAGQVLATSNAVAPGGVTGRLALSVGNGLIPGVIALGTASGDVVVLDTNGLAERARWTLAAPGSGFAPDFLWARLGGAGASSVAQCNGFPTLIAHDKDRVFALCPNSPSPLPGWGAPFGDSLVAGLAAGDVDGDGFPEVIVQTQHGRLAFLNSQTGRPSPGWPRAGSPEAFVTNTPPMAMDLNGDGLPEIVSLNASGVIAALDRAGRTPDGWPLPTALA